MGNLLDTIEAAEKVIGKFQEVTGDPDLDECLQEILTTPAVDNLGFLSLLAKEATESPLSERFQLAAQGLIDFLEKAGHGNIIKEATSIDRLAVYYPVNIPKVFQR